MHVAVPNNACAVMQSKKVGVYMGQPGMSSTDFFNPEKVPPALLQLCVQLVGSYPPDIVLQALTGAEQLMFCVR